MKLLHVIPSLDPATGGPAEGLRQLVRVSMDLGHTVEVATVDMAGSPYLDNLPFAVYALGPHVPGYGYSSQLVPWLAENAGNFDAVIVEGLWMYHGYATWKALRKSNTPYFVFTHGMLDPWFRKTYPLKHLKKWLYWSWVEYRVLRDAKAVLFTCEEERILAKESFWLYKCNERVVGYGTVAPSGNPELQREAFLGSFPELRDKRLFLFLSRIHEKKGCDILIESFARVADKDDSLHLVLAGHDQSGWKKDLVALSEKLGISDRITWTGLLTGDMKWGAYHASEVFILPSHQENFGVVVVEALACGLPVLISNKVNIWREIEMDGAGLVSEDTVQGTTGLLENWLSTEVDRRISMRQEAKNCFDARFEVRRAAMKLIGVLKG